MKRLIFLKSWLMYQAGETAGFDAAVASELMASGVAVDAEAAAMAQAEAEAAAKAQAEAEAAAKAQAGKKAV